MRWGNKHTTRTVTMVLAWVLGSLELWALQKARWGQRRAISKG